MRLRNIPRAESVLEAHDKVIKNEKELKGRWKEVFGNDNPVYIEIGMGKGQFLTEMAARHPDRNYIGIERYSSVLLRAVERLDKLEADSRALENIRFICMDAAQIGEVFEKGEVRGIYLNFSDPWPKKRHARRRLTSRGFFARYDQVLAPEGRVEFKTDNQDLFRFSLEEADEAGWRVLMSTWDLHSDPDMNRGNVMTEYEEKFSAKGNPICKLIAGRQRSFREGESQ
ncbi:tRNA (guanosine(46)-N7)-methyltransferase TrmB [Faecalicatena contorta]|uniref:tRNA (guanosine(46)-N7)-methyltransferase TrmB n=1 Tax=Faecalicatena contorta TaxID=39482 RepID=UPI001960F779|nr:tRNA (guanosine(46)-N7)-methyltransferase TrmB [Faecalicatena contorta]MBM6685146.1 tRNA (guanosine(46)-N7)-methyltransferase TrmB [Faecalicatena contorta]MBM6710992.1 tRNA (guanosine(46)-N7)-methyltransferase TrmB [Faecalicatena contorta]